MFLPRRLVGYRPSVSRYKLTRQFGDALWQMWKKEDSGFRNRVRETYELWEKRDRIDTARLEMRDRTNTAKSRVKDDIKIEEVVKDNAKKWKADPRLFFQDTSSRELPDDPAVVFYVSMFKSEGEQVWNQCRRRIRCLTYYRIRERLGPQSKGWRSLPKHFSLELSGNLARPHDKAAEDLKRWADAGAHYNAIVMALDMDSLFLLPHGTGNSL